MINNNNNESSNNNAPLVLKNIHHSDINSAYLHAITKDFPSGSPTFVYGENLTLESIGYYYAYCVAPDNLRVYLLPDRDIYGQVTYPKYSLA